MAGAVSLVAFSVIIVLPQSAGGSGKGLRDCP